MADDCQSTPEPPLVTVEDLTVTFTRQGRQVPALRGVSLSVRRGEILGLVGESGSGKTVLGLTLLGLLSGVPAPLVTGRAVVSGVDMASASPKLRQQTRRAHLGAVFQNPMSSLDPTMRVGHQLAEAAPPDRDLADLLGQVGLGDAQRFLRAYPHELSGGQRQRVMMAMAIARRPSLVIADEPTTALDVTIQAQILRLATVLRKEVGCSFLFITHDLAVAAEVSDRLVVMYAGRVAEIGSTSDVLNHPQHPYTAALLASRLTLSSARSAPIPSIPGSVPAPHELPPGCAFAPRCRFKIPECEAAPPPLVPTDVADALSACIRHGSLPSSEPAALAEPTVRPPASVAEGPATVLEVRDVRKSFRLRKRSGGHADTVRALDGVSLTLAAGESVALVGESGSGKSTLLRAIARLTSVDSGEIEVSGSGDVQLIFQDAASSLTPWMTVGSLIEERIRSRGISRARAAGRTREALELVGLPAVLANVRPRQLSGGQAQRVAIARAVAVPPRILLADEPTSALDVSLAATILNLLAELRRRLGLSMVFVTHDLAVARLVADRVIVMRDGVVVEQSEADQVILTPTHEYTKTLVRSVPGLPGYLAGGAR